MKPPEFLLVHTMGKVGSYSIFKALKVANKSAPARRSVRILHTHQLNRRTIDSFKRRSSSVPRHIAQAEEFLAGEHAGRVRIVTSVREPLGRNISAFFENLQNFGFPKDPSGTPIATLLDTFVRKYAHQIPARWFDQQVHDVFGIDVFAEPLDFSKGGQVIVGERADLLLLRLEDPEDARQEAIRRFTGFDDFELARLNAAEAKSYGDSYRQFKSRFCPQAPFIDKLYRSRYARHFYSDGELAGFRRGWLG